FGDSAEADVALLSAQWQGTFWQLAVQTPLGRIDCHLHIAGRHNVLNALAAIACAVAMDVPLAAIRQGLEAFEPVAGRSRASVLQFEGGQQLTLVDDSYNANPDSVRAAIDVLAELPGPRLLVLGDMGEVGTQSDAFHAEVGAWARERGIEHFLALGEATQHSINAFAADATRAL